MRLLFIRIEKIRMGPLIETSEVEMNTINIIGEKHAIDFFFRS